MNACWWRDLILRYNLETLDSGRFFIILKGYRGTSTVIFGHVAPITPGKPEQVRFPIQIVHKNNCGVGRLKQLQSTPNLGSNPISVFYKTV